jgi:hypothetical protein
MMGEGCGKRHCLFQYITGFFGVPQDDRSVGGGKLKKIKLVLIFNNIFYEYL